MPFTDFGLYLRECSLLYWRVFLSKKHSQHIGWRRDCVAGNQLWSTSTATFARMLILWTLERADEVVVIDKIPSRKILKRPG